jgi:ParB family transcriptional regulator, chromosome partitioning protein
VSQERTPGAPRRRGLGRGLGALLSPGPEPQGPGDGDEGNLIQVDPTRVSANPEQPRQDFDEAGLSLLADSIRDHGLLQPIVVERDPDGHGYRLVAGERRLRAAGMAGLRSIPAILRPATDSGRHALELALVENLQRTDLSAVEEAMAYARLADTFGLSHEAIGARVGRSRAAVSNTIRLLALPAAVLESLAAGRISAGHARALLGLPSAAEQEALAAEVAARGLSVREVEAAVQERSGRAAPHTAPTRPARPARMLAPTSPPDRDDEALRRGLEEALGTPVHLQRGRRGGRLVIDFYGDEMLDALYTRLGGPPL